MNLLILEPPYSHLFKELAKALKPNRTHVHLFNLGYLIYLPNFRFSFVSLKLRNWKPRQESIQRVHKIRSLANSNIKTPNPLELRLMAAYLEYFESFVKENQITHVICHNDLRWQHAIAREVTQELGVEIFFSEEGLFRPHTLTFDPKGVNAFSSVPRSPDFYERHGFTVRSTFRPLINRQLARALRLFYFVNFMILNKFGDLLRINVPLKNKNYSINQYLKLFVSKVWRANTNLPKLGLSRKFIFVPLQVSTDTQTIIHSKYKSTQEVIKVIEEAYLQLPDSFQAEYALVFKQHPMEAHLSYIFAASSIVSSAETSGLLEDCSIVVLVNSTTIVDALKKLKPIIALGDSHYEIPGILKKSDDNMLSRDIQTCLTDAKSSDPKIVQSFLNYLQYNYQINGNIFYYDDSTVQQIKDRMYVRSNP